MSTSTTVVPDAGTPRAFDPHRDGGIDRQPDVARTTHAEQSRTLIQGQGRALLSTICLNPAGFPFGSLVTYCPDDQGRPWLLISTMAEHTRNASADPRASVLISDEAPPEVDPLALARVSLVGTLVRSEPTSELRAQFLDRHPGALSYVDFPDFSWWVLEVEAIRYVGGFGRMSWVDAAEFSVAQPDPIAPSADGIISHMNADHVAAQILLVQHFLGHDAIDVRMTGVDRLGCEMDVTLAASRMPLRLPFPRPMTSSEDVHHTLVAMLHEARAAKA
jgi:heme iron utilization protein